MHRLLVLARAVVGMMAPDGSELAVAVAVLLEAASGRSRLGTGAKQLALEDEFGTATGSIGLVAVVVQASCRIVTVEAARSRVSIADSELAFWETCRVVGRL